MNKELEKEEDTPVLEGETQTPNQRTKDFNSVTELASWLDLTRPDNIRVETGMLGGNKIYRLITYLK